MSNDEKLIRMLKYVSEHNDFYKKRIKEYGITNPLDITSWPILTRKELQENRYNMFSNGYKTKYLNQQLRRQSSSGSTGMPIQVYWDYKDWYASNMCLWRKRAEWYGIKPSNRCAIFTLNAFGITNTNKKVHYVKTSNILSCNLSLIQNQSGYLELVDILNEFNPDWLYIQPSALHRLIKAYKYKGEKAPNRLKYIESCGEVLTSDIQRAVNDCFNVPFANMYGSEEMNGIAYECPSHHLHVLEENVLLETSDKNEVILTSLTNRAMPLIRYAQGDTLILNTPSPKCAHEICACGISSIFGRTQDSILVDNKDITTICLSEIMAEAINQYDNMILTYRFVYSKSRQELCCYLSISDEFSAWFNKIAETIQIIFLKKIGSPKQLYFTIRHELFAMPTIGKRKILEIIESDNQESCEQ